MSDLLTWHAPYLGWALMLLLATMGGALAAWGFFPRSDRTRNRCPRCGYDLSHSPSSTCSECGRTLRSPEEAHRRPRRVGLAGLGLLIAVALPTFAIQRRVRVYGWDYYARLYPIYYFSPHQTLAKLTYGPYTIRHYVDRRRDLPGNDEYEHLVIYRKRKKVFAVEDRYITLGFRAENPAAEVLPIFDVDHDGTPELICETDGGGSGGPRATYFLRLGPQLEDLNPHAPAPPESMPNDGFACLSDLDRDGTPELIAVDFSFAYFHTSHAGSHYPRVAYRWVNRRLILAPDLFARIPRPVTSDDFAAARRDCLAAGYHLGPYDMQDELFSPLLGTMLDLIFSGRTEEAWTFLDSAWPGTEPQKRSFLGEFQQQIEASPFHAALITLGYRPYPASPSPLTATRP